MNHKQLHDNLSNILNDLVEGKVKPQFAREYFNGAGKLIANCKNELVAVSMGAIIDVPLLDISSQKSGGLVRLNRNQKSIK